MRWTITSAQRPVPRDGRRRAAALPTPTSRRSGWRAQLRRCAPIARGCWPWRRPRAGRRGRCGRRAAAQLPGCAGGAHDHVRHRLAQRRHAPHPSRAFRRHRRQRHGRHRRGAARTWATKCRARTSRPMPSRGAWRNWARGSSWPRRREHRRLRRGGGVDGHPARQPGSGRGAGGAHTGGAARGDAGRADAFPLSRLPSPARMARPRPPASWPACWPKAARIRPS